MKDNSSVYFYLKLLYFGQKEPFEVKFSLLSGWVRINEIPNAMLETATQCFCKLCNFSVMRDNSSLLFKLTLYMSWTKGAHQNAKFQTFDCAREISILYFDRLLLLKVYKISVKKVQRNYFS